VITGDLDFRGHGFVAGVAGGLPAEGGKAGGVEGHTLCYLGKAGFPFLPPRRFGRHCFPNCPFPPISITCSGRFRSAEKVRRCLTNSLNPGSLREARSAQPGHEEETRNTVADFRLLIRISEAPSRQSASRSLGPAPRLSRPAKRLFLGRPDCSARCAAGVLIGP